ncbi:MAG TPA: hypothetical protein VGQ73_04565 [Gemmatimonadales bacterium]|jgi:hypothetical protein|nr:hypothetical protein [Gemmatimonadales bacterium]
MNIQLVAFGFGCLLLMVAILGGGFEVKELKVPKVGRAPRFAACLFGVLFVFIGIKSDLNLTALAKNKTEATAAQPALPIASVPAPAPIAASNMAQSPMQIATGNTIAQPVYAGPQAPQQVRSGNETPQPPEAGEAKVEKARPTATSSSRDTKKVPWEQKPRRWLQRFKAARG